MKEIFLLTDYKDHFGSKHNDVPYRSGMDKNLLKRYFAEHDFETKFLKFSDVDFRKMNFKNKYVLYTSTEDNGYYYKAFIEDIIFSLELAGAKVIPSFKYLHATNNKVFMEKLRDILFPEQALIFNSLSLGSWEELIASKDKVQMPCVIKTFEGASGEGVFLAKNWKELEKITKKISRTRDFKFELWDLCRSFKHKGYMRDSLYRKKYIIQNFITGLKNDWKIYVFGNQYFIFYRPVFKSRGFRASGGGYDNYFYGNDARSPEGIFDFARNIFNKLQVPHASLDIVFDGERFFLLEFQCIYFGTAGILYSKEYSKEQNLKWISQPNVSDIEKVYVESIVEFIENK
jgi:glutathione synthase/RimK-type ligase-like ATP-grasp enzyme